MRVEWFGWTNAASHQARVRLPGIHRYYHPAPTPNDPLGKLDAEQVVTEGESALVYHYNGKPEYSPDSSSDIF